MTLIFGSCQDAVGYCVRQYFMFFLCLISAALASYSSFKTYRMENQFTFELLPLLINTLTSIFMLVIFVEMEHSNAEIYLYIVEFYTYFVLFFGFVMIVLKQSDAMKNKVKVMLRIFILVTVFAVVGIILITVLRNSSDIIKCTTDQGTSKIVLLVIELPIIIGTLYYVRKFKQLLNNQTSKYENIDHTVMTKHLVEQEDRYIVLKQQQANLVQAVQIINFVMHMVELVLFYAIDQQQICNANDEIQVTNGFQVFILWVQNIVEIFPHFMIPIIFWYMPAKANTRFQTVFISEASNVSESHRRSPLPKIKLGDDHQQSQFYQNLHNQENIRQKLAPGTPKHIVVERTTSY